VSERGKERIAKKREEVITNYQSQIALASAEHDGFLWLMDHGISLRLAIFYRHTGRFGFGWQRPVELAMLPRLLEVLKDFPSPYEIKVSDGRLLRSQEQQDTARKPKGTTLNDL
jgi:hypothetical protein